MRILKVKDRHWELSLQLDEGATNLCIDQIFMVMEDLIDGKFIAGAGGGGYLALVVRDAKAFVKQHPEAFELHIRRE